MSDNIEEDKKVVHIYLRQSNYRQQNIVAIYKNCREIGFPQCRGYRNESIKYTVFRLLLTTQSTKYSTNVLSRNILCCHRHLLKAMPFTATFFSVHRRFIYFKVTFVPKSLHHFSHDTPCLLY